MRLSDIWWQHIHTDPPPARPDAACPHTTLLSRWSSTTDSGPRETVQDWLCAACHRVFTTDGRTFDPAPHARDRSERQDLMKPAPLTLYLASYETADGAEEDFAGVRRLRRDGVIGTAVAGVIARDTAGWLWHTAQPHLTPDGESRADDLLGVLFPPKPPVSRDDATADLEVPETWRESEAEQEFREQLATAGAAVVVLAEERIAPALRVALARAHHLVQHRLTARELHRAVALQGVAATTG